MYNTHLYIYTCTLVNPNPFVFLTLVTGPRRSSSLLADPRRSTVGTPVNPTLHPPHHTLEGLSPFWPPL